MKNSMYRILRGAAAVGLVSGIAACGGGGGSSAQVQDVTPPDPVAIDSFLQTDGRLNAAAERATAAQVAAIGTATYNGAFDGTRAGSALTADVAIAVRIQDSAADVTLSGFNAGLTGTLSGDGTIVADASTALPQFFVTTEGILQDGGQSLPSEIALDGSFLQSDGDATGALAGQAEGVIGGVQVFDGRFAAVR